MPASFFIDDMNRDQFPSHKISAPAPTPSNVSSYSSSLNLRSMSTTSMNSLFDYNPTTQASTVADTPNNASSTTQINQLIRINDLHDLIHRKLSNKTIIMLVGLPASGKSTISKQLCQYLNDNNIKSDIYNAGNTRRSQRQSSNSEFFNPSNTSAKAERELYANMTMNNLLHDLEHDIVNVGFLDATNTTKERRARMLSIIKKSGVQVENVIILDIQCNDEQLLNFNICGKAHNDDYKDVAYKDFIEDFKERTKHYFKVYEPVITEELNSLKDISVYAKVLNGGQDYSVNYVHPQARTNATIHHITDFLENYYNTEGKRYFEAVDAFYSR